MKKLLESPILIIFIGIIFLGAAGYIMFYGKPGEPPPPIPESEIPLGAKFEPETCETSRKTFKVSDDGMQGIFQQGEDVSVTLNYYACNKPQRGDYVLVETAGRSEPIVRMIAVLPGDRFAIPPEDDENQFFNLAIDNAIIQTPDGMPYRFSERKSKLLRLYEKSLKGLMQQNIYFIFGTKPGGGYDSTRFGTIERAKILGKIEN